MKKPADLSTAAATLAAKLADLTPEEFMRADSAKKKTMLLSYYQWALDVVTAEHTGIPTANDQAKSRLGIQRD